MAGLGIGIAWFGYWVMYYGITQIKGDNYGFLDLGVPGRWAKASGNLPDQGKMDPTVAAVAASAPPHNPQTGLSQGASAIGPGTPGFGSIGPVNP